MTRLFGATLLLICTSLLGCGGREFIRPAPDTFILGTTTYPEVMQRMGEPYKSENVVVRNATLKKISYVFLGETLPDELEPSRQQVYFFHSDILVGDSFTSSFKSDSTNFDEAKAQSFVKGKTTRDEVIQKLGSPAITLIAPMCGEEACEQIGYQYHSYRDWVVGPKLLGYSRRFSKVLFIVFDSEGKVVDIEYVTKGSY